MSTLYLEPFSGLSGDMLNALLLDLGADRKHLEEALKTISLDGYHLHVDRIAKSSIWGTDFDVHMEHGEKDHGIAGDFDHHHHEHDHDHHEHEHHMNCSFTYARRTHTCTTLTCMSTHTIIIMSTTHTHETLHIVITTITEKFVG